jgi:chromosome segregation ATPase
MTLNIITFFSCLLLLIIFRKIDRSNLKIAKLRKYSSKVFDDFKSLSETESRKFRDATIEMDILIKKSNALTGNMSSSLKDVEVRLKGLDIEKTNLKKVDEDLKVISSAARDVNKQLEFISSARHEFKDMAAKIAMLTESISSVKNESASIVQNFNNRIRERSKEITEEFDLRVDQMKGSLDEREEELIRDSEQKIEVLTSDLGRAVTAMEKQLADMGDSILDRISRKVDSVEKGIDEATMLIQQVKTLKSTLADLENNVFSDINETRETMLKSFQKEVEGIREEIAGLNENVFAGLKDKAGDLRVDINKAILDFTGKKEDLFARLETDIEKLLTKFTTVETSINNSKDGLIKTFEGEVGRIRAEFDSLSIHAVAKKDDIVQAARREAEEVRKKLEDFEEKFVTLENRLIDTAEARMDHLDSEYNSIELRINSLIEKLKTREEQINNSINGLMDGVKNEFTSMEQRITSMKSELTNYEEQSKIFSRADSMMQKADEALAGFTKILVEAQSESKTLEKVYVELDQFKEIRKNVEREIRIYDSKKDKMSEVEAEIKGILELNDVLASRFDNLKNNISKVDVVSAKIEALTTTYSHLEGRIEELREYEDMITKNLESVSKADMLMQGIDSRIKSYQRNVEKSEKRVDIIEKHLQRFEENTLVMKSREKDIIELKEKFNELEGYSEHVQRRIEQVQAMFRKVDSLKDEIETTDTRLQEMYSLTDKKMREFADFIQTVDSNSPISKQVKQGVMPGRNLSEVMIKTIRELSNKGWDAPEISRKLMVDENSVRLIINTGSL